MFLWYLIILNDYKEDNLSDLLKLIPKEFAPLVVWISFIGYIFFPMKNIFNPLGR